MSIFDVLVERQREHKELLQDIRSALTCKQRELAHALFQLLANRLTACMRAEHSTLYPRLARDPRLVEETAQARRDHDAIEAVITRLRIAGLHADAWADELQRLADLVAQHAELEAQWLFPLASLLVDRDELTRLSGDFIRALAITTSVADVAITYEPMKPEPRIVTVRPRAA